MKKILSVLLGFVLLFSMTTIAFADGESDISINSLQFKRGSEEDYLVRNDIIDGRYAAVLNLTNAGIEQDVVVITALYEDGENKLKNINYQKITVLPGTADYQTQDLSVTSSNENTKIKTMLWNENYAPIIDPLYFGNQGSAASITAGKITLTAKKWDQTNNVDLEETVSVTKKAYINTESNTLRIYADNLEMLSDSEREAINSSYKGDRDVMGNYYDAVNSQKPNRNLCEDYPTIIKNITPELTVTGGQLLSNNSRDFSNDQVYTVVDADRNIKTYTVCLKETAVVNGTSFNQTPNPTSNTGSAGYTQQPNSASDPWNRRGQGSWQRAGWLGQYDYDYSSNKWSRVEAGSGNYAIKFEKTSKNIPYDWNIQIGTGGNISSGVRDAVVEFKACIESLDGKGIYAGGILSGYVGGTQTARAGRHALVFQPAEMPENMIDIKYIEGLDDTLRTTQDKTDNKSKYEDILSISGNPQVKIGDWHTYTLIYKNEHMAKPGGGIYANISTCPVELYIDGKYIAELPSWYNDFTSPNLYQTHFVLGGYSGENDEGTTYSFLLDELNIQFNSTATKYAGGSR